MRSPSGHGVVCGVVRFGAVDVDGKPHSSRSHATLSYVLRLAISQERALNALHARGRRVGHRMVVLEHDLMDRLLECQPGQRGPGERRC